MLICFIVPQIGRIATEKHTKERSPRKSPFQEFGMDQLASSAGAGSSFFLVVSAK